VFSSSERKNAIYFHYPWAEQDNVEIDLPEGFALDNADAPEDFGSANLSQYKTSFESLKIRKSLSTQELLLSEEAALSWTACSTLSAVIRP